MKQTVTEQNYLKTIYHQSQEGDELVSTNTIAQVLGTTAASVTDMLKKLNEKGWVKYAPYKGATLSDEGRKIALLVIRKHRLWEVFLREKLQFSWEKIHEIAEQLEHIESEELIQRLDNFLGNPQFDPHGAPIPTAQGILPERQTFQLSEMPLNAEVILVGVSNGQSDFLQYLNQLQIGIGTLIKIVGQIPFDQTLQLEINQKQLIISGNIAERLWVEKA